MRTDTMGGHEAGRGLRRETRGILSIVVAGAVAVVFLLGIRSTLAGQAAGQDPVAPPMQAVSSGWLPWAGCWEAYGDFGMVPAARGRADPTGVVRAPNAPRAPGAPGAPVPPPAAGDPGPDDSDVTGADGADDSAVSSSRTSARTITCIRPGEGELVAEILTVEGDEDLGEPEVWQADGQRRSAAREGCEGWESARFSGDAARVYLESRYTCRGDVERRSSGIFSLVSPWEWLDVRSVESGGEVRTWTRRYQRIPAEQVERAELREWAAVEEELALETARIALSGPPSLDDIIEASNRVHGDAVVAWVAEEGDPVPLDGDALLELADAGVPGTVTDVLVALDNPETFVLGSGGEVRAEAPVDGRRGYGRRPPRRIISGIGVWGGWGPYRPGFGLYGRYAYDPFYHPWGYTGYGWGYGGYTYRPAIVYVQPRSSVDSGGRIVRGRGYTRPGSTDGSRTGASRTPGASSRGSTGARAPSRGRGDGGSVSPSDGYRGGSSSGSTGRTAVPRGDGDGGN